jgi:hypothetical protein
VKKKKKEFIAPKGRQKKKIECGKTTKMTVIKNDFSILSTK